MEGDTPQAKQTTVQVEHSANELLDELRFRRKVAKGAATSAAVRYWAPRVLSGAIKWPERDSAGQERAS